jgi:glycosyltransferase involved in cell wall biosynthesis
MPRVLLVFEYPTLAGGEMSVLATVDAVRAAGFDIVAAAPPHGHLAAALRRRRVTLQPFCVRDQGGTRWPLGALRRELRRAVHATMPDLVHANSVSMGRLVGPVRAALGVPSVAHLRDIVRLSRRAIADLNCHTRLVAVSHATRDYHVAAGLAAAKTVVVPSGVDLAMFRPRPAHGGLHRQLGLPAGAPLIGTIGQISLRKGIDVLLEAAGRVVAEWPAAHFVLAGARFSQKPESQRLEQDLRRAAADGMLAGHVHFVGFWPDVAGLLSELTLLAHPARQEPLGRVLLEAAASGVAVVATDVGGTPEIFPPAARAARLVPANAPEQLAHALLALLRDPDARRRLGAAARQRMADRFDLARAATGLVGQYQAALNC